MAKPLVSVIVPTFNFGRFVGETIAAVQAQTWTNWECVIVDDGSTDDTPDLCRAAAASDARIKCVRQDNRGHAAAKNAGVARSVGQYVQFLDADDLLERDKLRGHVAVLEAEPDLDIVYGPVRYFADDRPNKRFLSLHLTNEPWMPLVSGRGEQLLPHLLRQNIVALNCPLVRRQVLLDVGPFDEAIGRVDDWDFWLRCALGGKSFAYRDAPETTALVRCHTASLTRRHRGVIRAQLHMRRKVAPSRLSPDLRRLNAEMIEWLQDVDRVANKISSIVPAGTPFLLVDQDSFRPELIGFDAIPLTECNGQYNGPPLDDETAVAEIRTRRQQGVDFMIFAAPAFWWLDSYVGLRRYLDETARVVASDDDIIAYHFSVHGNDRGCA